MKKQIISNIFLVILISTKPTVSEEEVPCESIENHGWWTGSHKTCLMKRYTAIYDSGFTIESEVDESIGGLTFAKNKKILFLPQSVGEKFPKLIGYDAGSCSIKSISKSHFEGLAELRELYLGSNAIEKISRDTFEGLTALERLNLHGNKIKLLNGEAFANLPNLKLVYLGGNKCISKDFDNKNKIATIQKTVSDKCGFCNAIEDVTCEVFQGIKRVEENLEGRDDKMLLQILETQKQQSQVMKNIEVFMGSFMNEMMNKTSQIEDLKMKLAKVEAELEIQAKKVLECGEKAVESENVTEATEGGQ